MRNLIQFLIKNYFFFLFLLLEISAIYLILANNSFQRTTFISASNKVSGGMLSFVSNATAYFNLQEENYKLAAENAVLRSQLKESKLMKDSFQLFSDTLNEQFYSFMEARIISNSFHSRNNYLILDKGKNDGIREEMGVISSNGVVGIVNSVSKNFCSVISILHKVSAIDAKILSNGYTGTTFWDGKDYTKGKLKNIPNHTKLKKGDEIVTSGNSAIFPPMIPIGFIDDFSIEEGDNFFNINFTFSVDYNKIRHVYIIDNIHKEELEQIIKEANEN